MKNKALSPLVLAVMFCSILSIVAVQAQCPKAGLTPGFWKNRGIRLGIWGGSSPVIPYDPADLFDSYFIDGPYPGSFTLLDALKARGGSGVEGAKLILARAAVAALLNSAYFDSLGVFGEYKYSISEIKTMVNGALASGNRQTMIELAENLDYWNNIGIP